MSLLFETLVYLLAAIISVPISRRLGEFRWDIGIFSFAPRLESSFTLEIVDENSRSPFLDFNATIGVRWVDFPWNDYVKTTFAMGIGLSYSEKIYLMDIVRHPGEERSHLKFNWPMQLTFARPGYEHRQCVPAPRPCCMGLKQSCRPRRPLRETRPPSPERQTTRRPPLR